MAYEGKQVKIVWKIDGATIFTNDSRISIESGFDADKLYMSILSLSPASGSIDSGLYSCAITVLDEYIRSDTVTAEKNVTISCKLGYLLYVMCMFVLFFWDFYTVTECIIHVCASPISVCTARLLLQQVMYMYCMFMLPAEFQLNTVTCDMMLLFIVIVYM